VIATSASLIKRKVCICLLRLYRRESDSIQSEEWRKKLGAFFHDGDVGLLTSVAGLAIAILEQGAYPVAEWAEIIPPVTECLHRVVQGDLPEHYVYYHVPAPWLQTKLLRILQFFPHSNYDTDTLTKVNSILSSILTKPTVQRTPPSTGGANKKRSKADAERQNRSNAEHAILFESVNLVIALENKCDAETTRTASSLLGQFISSTDANIRYLGLETMARMATNVDTYEHLERYKNLILEKMHESDISIRRQALNLLYAVCRPGNWQQIVDELLDILGHSDALLQEELALKIAILAEKNAPNPKWYVDVVFRMLESAPNSVGDDVWYRVVQVVTGFEDTDATNSVMTDKEKTDLQRHAATKSYQNLQTQFPHETLVKLGAYLIGEFGHSLPDSIAGRSKFDLLVRHYTRAAPQTKGIILLACVKLLNANPDELRVQVVSFLEDIQESLDIELQQRTCELLHLVKDDDLLESVLTVMPSYSEAIQQNNPLIQRLKFQSKSRAQTRDVLEVAAKSEGGIFKPGTSLKKGAFSDVESSPERSHATARELGGIGRPRGSAEVSGSESDSGSETESDEEPHRNGGANSQSSGGTPRDLWTQLCILPSNEPGGFFQSGALCLDLRQEYNQAQGRLTIRFSNKSREAIGNIRVILADAPFMRFRQASQPPSSLQSGQTAEHLVEAQCLAPFLQPAKYLVEYVEGGHNGQTRQLPLMLPAILTKFVAPTELPMPQFMHYFEEMAGPPRENQLVSPAKVSPDQWPQYLAKGFNLHIIAGSNASSCCAAGTFHTGTPNPQDPGKMMTVPCMVKLDFDPGRQLVRMIVRSSHADVTAGLSKVMESYLLGPAPSNGRAPPTS